MRADEATEAGGRGDPPREASGDRAGDAPGAARRLLTRRRFLAVALLGGSAALATWRLGFYDHEERLRGLRHLSPTQGAILLAALEALLPGFADRSPDALAEHVRFIDGYLDHIPRLEVRAFRMCLYAIEHATTPLTLRLRRMSALSLEERERYLYGWQTSGRELLRLGLRSLRTLAFLALYRHRAAWEAIGYAGPMASPAEIPADLDARYARLLAPSGARPGAAP